MKATDLQKKALLQNILLIQTALDECRNAVKMGCELEDIFRRVDILGQYVAKAIEAQTDLALDQIKVEPGMRLTFSGDGKITVEKKVI